MTINGPVFAALPFVIGIQTFLVTYSKRLPCPVGARKSSAGGAVSGSGISAFFSFFSLVQVGCCGTWLYLLSLLPGVFGLGITGFLIDYSGPLTALGFILMIFSLGYTIRSVLKAKKLSKQSTPQN